MRAAPAFLCLAAFAAQAAPETFEVDLAHTYPSFEVSHLGISTQRGRFEKTSGRIVLDREAGTGSIDLRIEAASVSTGNRLLDGVLKGEDFFDAATHPFLTFRSSALEFEGGVPKRAVGELTMVGTTRRVSIEVARFGCTRLPFFVRLTCGADVTARLKRSEFGMGAFAGLVGDEVLLEVQIEAVKQEPAVEAPPAGG